MELVRNELSPQLFILFNNWVEEYYENLAHDTEDNKAWNELICYLMELEKGKSG